MSAPILTTKLHVPSPPPQVVCRTPLIDRLNAGLHRRLTLMSAPAGFGKTTLVSEWVAGCDQPVAWLALDEADSDPQRFLSYVVAAVQTVACDVGHSAMAMLQMPQPPPIEAVLTVLLNDLAAVPHDFIFVLDDYHLMDAHGIDDALVFLLEHLPPQMHLVIATREDPQLPLARWRARGHLSEMRVADLRFTFSEAAEFLNQAMGLALSAEAIAALEARTEGWIAGLQLAAISMQGHEDTDRFIESFTGSHHFVLDYLLEEVLQQQPASLQRFLLRTSILDRLCGPLCDVLVQDAAMPGQDTLEQIAHANLFLVPLDNERRWYRYHHLFADLLRQRLSQDVVSLADETGPDEADLHRRASAWFEGQGLELEAFHHAVAANDVERAERLAEGGGMPLHFRGAVVPVLNWLESLPVAVLDAKPSLWVKFASVLSVAGQNSQVEEKLQAAEAALQGAESGEATRNLIGHIAAIRALLAALQYDVEAIIAQSQRALDYLHPDNLSVRAATMWKLGLAYQFRGDRGAARQAFSDAIGMSEATGNTFVQMLAMTGLGYIQEVDNQLHLAAQSYQRVLQLAGDPPPPLVCEALLGLARVCYQWNDLPSAQRHGQQSVALGRPIEMVDSFVAGEVFLARGQLARRDIAAAAATLAEMAQIAHQCGFEQQRREIAAMQVLVLLEQGQLAQAAELAQEHDLPLSQARVLLAQGELASALAMLDALYQRMEAKGWRDECLTVRVLQAVTLYAEGSVEHALQRLEEALFMAAPEGFIRVFVDEGPLMAPLLREALVQGILPEYSRVLLEVFEAETPIGEGGQQGPGPVVDQPLIEPLSERELEVLHLVAEGLSNREIGERLFLALDTVKGHNRRIFGKLQVRRRTEAVARARELGLLHN